MFSHEMNDLILESLIDNGRSGSIQKIEELLLKLDELISQQIKDNPELKSNYIIVDADEEVDQGSSPLQAYASGINEAGEGLNEGGYFASTQITLRLIAQMNDAYFRRQMVFKAKEKNDSLDLDYLLVNTAKINEIMHAYELNYEQAKTLTIRGMDIWIWILQGALVTRKQLPFEMYVEISSKLLELSIADTLIVMDAVHKKIFTNLKEELKSYLTQGFFSQYAYERHEWLLEQNYEQRLRY